MAKFMIIALSLVALAAAKPGYGGSIGVSGGHGQEYSTGYGVGGSQASHGTVGYGQEYVSGHELHGSVGHGQEYGTGQKLQGSVGHGQEYGTGSGQYVAGHKEGHDGQWSAGIGVGGAHISHTGTWDHQGHNSHHNKHQHGY